MYVWDMKLVKAKVATKLSAVSALCLVCHVVIIYFYLLLYIYINLKPSHAILFCCVPGCVSKYSNVSPAVSVFTFSNRHSKAREVGKINPQIPFCSWQTFCFFFIKYFDDSHFCKWKTKYYY